MSDDSRTRMRRRDRQVADEGWIEGFLAGGEFGVVATSLADQPFIHPRTYVYDPQAKAIYLHGAKTGKTHKILTQNDRVAFAVSRLGRLRPAPKASELGVEYESVVVFGRMVVVADPGEARHALTLLNRKYFPHLVPGRDYEDITETDLAMTAVFRIDIEAWSGKRSLASDDEKDVFGFGEKG